MTLADAIQVLVLGDGRKFPIITTKGLKTLFNEDTDAAFNMGLRGLVKVGLLERVARGLYVNKALPHMGLTGLGTVARHLRRNHLCYLSYESALAEFGSISQVPMIYIVATTGNSGKYSTCYGTVEFSHTSRSDTEILRNTEFDDRFGMRIASPTLAHEDLWRVRPENLHLVDQETHAEVVREWKNNTAQPMLDFISVASQIVKDNPGLASCSPAIEKELLHYEILSAMHEAGHLQHLTFKGGTCLRLCHRAQRFSEDLDFSGGESFDRALLKDIEDVLRKRIVDRYGLEVGVSTPGSQDGRDRVENRWTARVATRPTNSSSRLKVQRVKIEVDNNPHPPDIECLPIQPSYALLADYCIPFPIRTAPLVDIYADKMIAFPMSVLTRENLRYRDMWDIEWIAGRLTEEKSLLRQTIEKATALGITSQLQTALKRIMDRCPQIVESDGFQNTLRRFVSEPLATKTIGDLEYRQYLASATVRRCRSLLKSVLEVTSLGGPSLHKI